MLPFIIGIQIFFLIFARLFALFSSTTFWGSTLINARFRVLLGFLTTILMYPLLQEIYLKSFPVDWPIFWFWALNNVLIGLALGFLISMFFSLFQITGQFFAFQMGFGISVVMDPLSQEQMPIVGQMLAMFALLVFISVNGHLSTIDILYKSFSKVPLMDFSKDLSTFLDKSTGYFSFMFSAALQFSMSIMGSILIATLFIGLLAKAAPQINAMMFGFPLYIALGFLLLSFLTPNIVNYMGNYINSFLTRILGAFP